MDLNDCKGGKTSSDNARARARLSDLRSRIGPAMRSDEYVLLRWRDTDGSMRRERVVPVAWKSRTELRTACGTIIDMNKIEEIGE